MSETAEPAQVTESGWYRHLDLIATILLAVATVMTAWSAFQANKWNGCRPDRLQRGLARRAPSPPRPRPSPASSRPSTCCSSRTGSQATARGERRAAAHRAVRPRPRHRTRRSCTSGSAPSSSPRCRPGSRRTPAPTPSAPPSPFVMPEYALEAATGVRPAREGVRRVRRPGPQATTRAQGQLRARHRAVRLGDVLLRHRPQAELPAHARRDGRGRPAPCCSPRWSSSPRSRSSSEPPRHDEGPGGRPPGPVVACGWVRRRGRSRAPRHRSCARRSSWSSRRRRPAHRRRRRRSRRPPRGRWRAASSRPG